MAVLDALSASAAAPCGDAPRVCPECMASYAPRDAGQLFCSTAHRRAWNNRWTTRGAVMAPLAAVARRTRNGTRGSRAAVTYGARAGRDLDVLLRRYAEEDRIAGRMAWEEWLKLRYQLGFDPI